MEKIIKIIEKLATDSPELFVIGFCFLIFLFKDNIKVFLKNRFNSQKETKEDEVLSHPPQSHPPDYHHVPPQSHPPDYYHVPSQSHPPDYPPKIEKYNKPIESVSNVINDEIFSKKENILDSFSRRATVFYFDRSITVIDADTEIKNLQIIIDQYRDKHQRLVFNLAETDTLIGQAKNVFEFLIKKILTENNIDFLLILPNIDDMDDQHINMHALIKSIKKQIKLNVNEAVKVKFDGRKVDRRNK